MIYRPLNDMNCFEVIAIAQWFITKTSLLGNTTIFFSPLVQHPYLKPLIFQKQSVRDKNIVEAL